jgi:hypothetical protein
MSDGVLRVDNLEPTDIYIGGDAVDAIYVGEDLVWPSTPPVVWPQGEWWTAGGTVSASDVVGAYQFKNAPSYEDTIRDLNGVYGTDLREAFSPSSFWTPDGLDFRTVTTPCGFNIPDFFGPTGLMQTTQGLGFIIKYSEFDWTLNASHAAFINYGHVNSHRIHHFLSRQASADPNRRRAYYCGAGKATTIVEGQGPSVAGISAMSGSKAWFDGVDEGVVVTDTPYTNFTVNILLTFFRMYIGGVGPSDVTPRAIIEAFAVYKNDALGQNIQAITEAMAQI